MHQATYLVQCGKIICLYDRFVILGRFSHTPQYNDFFEYTQWLFSDLNERAKPLDFAQKSYQILVNIKSVL